MGKRKKVNAGADIPPEFPNALFIRRECDTDGSVFYLADIRLDGVAAGERVAIYALDASGTVHLTEPSLILDK